MRFYLAARFTVARGLLLTLFFLSAAVAKLSTHKYSDGEKVILYVNKVGPFRNPQETYLYYDLPYCPPPRMIDVREGLGEALQGYELTQSALDIRFRANTPTTLICSVNLDEAKAGKFKHAVKNQYWYQLFLDDLPIWGMVGEVLTDANGEDKYFLYTHKKFSISYNNERIIEVNLTAENPIPIKEGDSISFTYSVDWYPTLTKFEHRFDKYLDNKFFEHQIHWFSIFNSFMMVIFLVGLVAMILMRTIRRDYARFAKEEDDLEDERGVGEESGWKQIHGDVFRAPTRLILFSSLIGTGHQLILLVFCVLFFAAVGAYYRHRGTVVTACILCYAFTSFVGGYASGGFYARNAGKNWIKNMFVTASLFPFSCFIIAFLLNYVAIAYGSLSFIPYTTMLVVLAIWAFIALPLTVVGTIVGKNWNGRSNYPCRINQVPRQIPDRPFFLSRWVNVVLGGLLPFGSIFIEMYFIFTSFWHYKYYYMYGFMLLVYIILILVTVCVTIVSVYFLLNAEDYRWHWIAFLTGASTAAYVYLYATYYFFTKTKMSGFFQTSFYFGYTLMFCVGIAIVCGSVGFIGASVFVQRIYRFVKID